MNMTHLPGSTRRPAGYLSWIDRQRIHMPDTQTTSKVRPEVRLVSRAEMPFGRPGMPGVRRNVDNKKAARQWGGRQTTTQVT